jgi:hypothetical protein
LGRTVEVWKKREIVVEKRGAFYFWRQKSILLSEGSQARPSD